ncbi:MAG: transketolase C-terminal domain-containing protein, partial [Nitrososphaerota archaeon]
EIDFNKPLAYGVMALPDTYMEFRKQLYEVLKSAPRIYDEIAEEYAKISGRRYGKLLPYFTEDAEVIVIALGSSVETLKYVAKRLRREGLKAGVLGITMYRPFPEEELVEILSKAKVVVVMDRAYSYGGVGGPLYTDVLSTLYKNDLKITIADFIYGLGGRDFKISDAEEIFKKAFRALEKGSFDQDIYWWGVKE